MQRKPVKNKKLLSRTIWQNDSPEWDKVAQAFIEILWSADLHGKIDYYNDLWFKYTGVKYNDFSKDITEFIHPDDLDFYKKRWSESLKSLKKFETQARIKGSDGFYRWYLIKAHSIKPREPELTRWMGLCVDINDQKELVHALSKSEKRFRALFEQSPISIQIFSRTGVPIKVNKAWKKMWGGDFKDIHNYNILKDKQLQDKGILPFIKKGFSGKYSKIPAIKYEPSKSVSTPASVLYCWVQSYIYPIRDEKDAIDEVVLMQEDITSRKNIEDILLQANQMLYAIIKASPLAIYVVDLDNRVKVWNKAAEKIFGWNEKEVINKPLPTISKEMVEEVKQLKEKIVNGDSFYVETKRARSDGTIIEVAISAAPLFDSNNEITDIIIVAADITERKEIEKRKDDFISIASHELKTPVTSMKVFLQILKNRLEKDTSDKETSYFLTKMESQLNKLNKLIKDLLDISRVQHGNLNLNYETFKIADLINDIVENISAITPFHKIVVNCSNTISVNADQDRIGQVLINLITNAIKYSPNSNSIIITVKKDKNYVKVSVKDFGIGIPEKYHEKIFDRFYQVADKGERTFPGLGIGLYICNQIISRHNGKIWCESQSGKGTVFYFTLPVNSIS